MQSLWCTVLQELSRGIQAACTAAKKPVNKPKNRFKDILPCKGYLSSAFPPYYIMYVPHVNVAMMYEYIIR